MEQSTEVAEDKLYYIHVYIYSFDNILLYPLPHPNLYPERIPLGQKMEPSTEVAEDEVVTLLNPVSKAMRIAQLKLLEAGFEVCMHAYIHI
jgi:hypothetical protein